MGDLHLSTTGEAAILRVSRGADAALDFDRSNRPLQTLAGADEPASVLFRDGFED
ncbi:MAG: hypothetical protein AB8B96_13340 [Lysobacterales bacterium]